MTVTGSDKYIVGSGRAIVTLPMGTTLHIEEALLYPESTRNLLSFKDIRANGFHVETGEEDNREYYTSLSVIVKKEY
jgi:peptide/histidine transporter 3/4